MSNSKVADFLAAHEDALTRLDRVCFRLRSMLHRETLNRDLWVSDATEFEHLAFVLNALHGEIARAIEPRDDKPAG